jgi:hypothetical protein
MTQEQKALYDTEAELIAELNKQTEALVHQPGCCPKSKR